LLKLAFYADFIVRFCQVDSRAHIFNWIDSLPGDGRYTFTRQDAEETSGSSFVAVQSALRRLKNRVLLVSPRRGVSWSISPEADRISGPARQAERHDESGQSHDPGTQKPGGRPFSGSADPDRDGHDSDIDA
jgi:hypothetical protein